MSLHAAFVGLYLVALIGVGALKARKIKSQEDFSLAGRGLPTFVLVGTLLATWIGTGSIFGNAEKTVEIGVAAFLLPISAVLGITLLWLLAARIRTFGQFTIQDILEARFGFGARVIGSATLLLAYVIIVSYQYRAGAAVLVRIVDVDPALATCIVAAFVIVYTALAGMYSVAYTDVANGILMTIGIACALPILWSEAGGWSGIEQALGGPLAVDGAQVSSRTELFGAWTPFALISATLPALLLLIGDANMYQRFFSARDPKEARRSALWMLLGVVLLECAIIAVALVGAALFAQGKVAAPANSAHVVVQLAFEALPPFLGAMLVATVVAVVVSTADSYLLAPATSMVRDVYQRSLKPSASPTEIVLAGRVVVVVLGLVALGLAFTSTEFFDVALFAYTIYGAGITPVLLAAFFWPRATKSAAVASMLTGVTTSIVWRFAVAPRFEEGTWLADVDAVLPAICASVVVLVVVSLATPAPVAGQPRVI